MVLRIHFIVLILFCFFVFFFCLRRNKLEENNKNMSCLTNSLASSILNRSAQDLKDKSSDLRVNRIKFCNPIIMSCHIALFMFCEQNSTCTFVIIYGYRSVIYLKYFLLNLCILCADQFETSTSPPPPGQTPGI